MKEEKKVYTCVCGKEFNNPQSFNGHKSHCKEHQINKHGSLIKYNGLQRVFREKGNDTRKNIAKEKRRKVMTLWISEQHKCEKCGKIMTEYYGSGRFCSRKCANSRRHSKATKERISNGVCDFLKLNGKIPTKLKPKRLCSICNKEIGYENKTGACRKCFQTSDKFAEYRSNVSAYASSFVKPENRSCWRPRNQVSYPENFFMKVLKNNNIEFVHDFMVKIDKKHWYYLDFYIEKGNTKLDLEIDGRQHEDEDRRQHDIKRNKDLNNLGYIVYRIKWNEINSEKGKNEMKNKIDNFLEFYDSL